MLSETTIETKVRQQYDRLATQYDRRWRSYIQTSLLFLQEWAAIAPTDAVLDVACGTGEFAALLLSETPSQRIVGVDISPEMLAQARQKLEGFPAVEFQVAIARSLPVPAKQFHTVVCANSFHFFDEPLQVLKEFRRVVKPNGRVLILDWCRDYPLCQLCDLALKVIDPGHHQCYTRAEMQRLLEDSGLRVRRITRMQFGLVWGLMAIEATL
ncbi:MAG: methyltransferase domain-containing protein [Synechococcales bacterium]|nr:methyltransferase domain-containing protein [Synechococcales bacterium]